MTDDRTPAEEQAFDPIRRQLVFGGGLAVDDEMTGGDGAKDI